MYLTEESTDLGMWVRATVINAMQHGHRFSSPHDLLMAACEQCAHWPTVTPDDLAYVDVEWEEMERLMSAAPHLAARMGERSAFSR